MENLEQVIRLGASAEAADFVAAFGRYHHQRTEPEGPALLQRAHWAYDRMVRAHSENEQALDEYTGGNK